MSKNDLANLNTPHGVYRFSKLSSAQSFTEHGVKIQMIVLGDEGEYIVCEPVIAKRLVAAGYEYAR